MAISLIMGRISEKMSQQSGEDSADQLLNPIQTRGRQIMPLTLRHAPPNSKSYLHLCPTTINIYGGCLQMTTNF